MLDHPAADRAFRLDEPGVKFAIFQAFRVGDATAADEILGGFAAQDGEPAHPDAGTAADETAHPRLG